MIKLQVIGNLGKDATVNTVNGRTVINFSVAHTERFRDSQGENKERVTWVECAYWSDRTAISQYLLKGQLVYVEGTPELRTYQKNDGTQGASLSLRINNVQLLGGRTNGGQLGTNTGTNTTGINDSMSTSQNFNHNTNVAAPSTAPMPNVSSAASNSPLEDDLPF